jgi:hypothetical protein
MIGGGAESAYDRDLDTRGRAVMATWSRKMKSNSDNHEPHLPHEDRSTQLIGAAVTLGVAAAAIAGTLALFS